MKKHIIRILTVLCMFCLGAALFVGCKPEEEKPDDTPTTYTVTYAANGGTGTAPAVEKYKEGETFKVKENPFTKDGSTFKTWNDGSKDYAPGATYTMPKKNVTFTAQWTGGETKEQVTVTFSLGENTTGKAPDAQKVNKGEEYTLPAAPEWAGHTFKGWKVGEDATLKQVGDKITPTADVTVTAQWEVQKEQVTVTIDLGGVPALNEEKPDTAWATPDPVQTNKDEEYTLPAAPAWWKGHMFAGWKIGETDDVKKAGEKITASANVTITAQWKEAESISSAALEVTDSKVYVVVEGAYEGYTDEAMLDALENANQRVLNFSVCLGHDPYTYVEPEVTAEAEDGLYTVKIDVTELGNDTYFILENRNGYGNVKTVTCNTTEISGDLKYQLVGSVGSDLTLTIGYASQSREFTDITLTQEGEKIYLNYAGTFKGYTESELKSYLEDEATFYFWGNGGAKSQKPATRVATVSAGTWTIKFDVTEMPNDKEYALCWKDGVGELGTDLAHPKADTTEDTTLTLNGRDYHLIAKAWNKACRLEIKDAEPVGLTCAVTGLDIELDGTAQKVYLIASGTFTGGTEAELKALFEGDGKMNVHFWDEKAGSEKPTSVVVTTSEATWTAKCDITDLKDGELRNVLINGELGLDIQDKTVVLGEKAYTLQKSNGYGHTGLRVGAKFARPSSARLELTPDKGNGKDENFKNDIDKAFFVISGKYYSEVTEDEAKTFFSKDKYPFEFGEYNGTKDRIRRISIDTSAHTYTVKFDVSWLPAGEHYCRFNAKGGDGDLKLSKTACPNNTVKAVGSTYTLTNYYGTEDHWGCIVLKVERNFAVTNVELKEESNKPILVVSGTFDSNYTVEQIEKFLKDEDVRSMCVDLTHAEKGWQKVTTEVTVTDGNFVVKVDLSAVADGTYGIAIDCSGYGDIKTLYTGTLTVGGKTYTFGKDGHANLTVEIKAAA